MFRRRKDQRIAAIAEALLVDPDAKHYGYDLGRQAGIRSGTIQPILWRWLAAGWLTAEWGPQISPGRPRRRYYVVTELGKRELGALARKEGP